MVLARICHKSTSITTVNNLLMIAKTPYDLGQKSNSRVQFIPMATFSARNPHYQPVP